MANIDKKLLDERCKQLWGKLDWPYLETTPPDFNPLQFIKCVDIIDKGIKLKNDDDES